MSLWNWLRLPFSPYELPFLVYLVVQIGAGYTLRGPRRVVALLPAPFMLALLVLTVVAIRQQSNLWWLPLSLASPVAALLVGIVWFFGWRSAARPRP